MNQKQVCTTLGVSSLTGACGVPAATSPWAPGEGNEPSNTHPQPVRRCPAYHPCRLHLPMLLPPAGWTALLRGQARPRMGTRRTPGQPTPLPAPSSPKEPAPLRNVACKQPLVSPEGLSIPQHLLTPCLYHCHRQHLCGHSLTPPNEAFSLPATTAPLHFPIPHAALLYSPGWGPHSATSPWSESPAVWTAGPWGGDGGRAPPSTAAQQAGSHGPTRRHAGPQRAQVFAYKAKMN